MKIPCVIVTRPDTPGNSCTYKWASASAIIDNELDDSEDGDSILLTFKMLEDEEVDALPYFEGW
jgi:hypothetical protein